MPYLVAFNPTQPNPTKPMPAKSIQIAFAMSCSALLALSQGVSASQQASAKPAAITYHSDDPGRWGAPLAWQPPAYPPSLLAQQITGRVDVLVSVSAEGRMTEIAAIRSLPAQPLFEEVVRDAIRSWTFTKALDAECKPVPTQSRVQVRFEMEEGKPLVNVGAAPAAKQAGHSYIEEANRAEVGKALADNYPRDARRMGKTGEVLALLKVDARTGETRSVDITEVFADTSSHNPEPRMTPAGQHARMQPRASPASIQFASVVREELAALRFKPVAQPTEDVITVCREVTFRMRGVANRK